MIDSHFNAVIPAGGSGSRLWPISRACKPKFLLPLPGPKTLIQDTVARLAPLSGMQNITIITGHAHVGELENQLPEIPRQQLVVEPVARGSGPAIGLATAIALQRDPDAIVGSFAADHIVEDTEEFQCSVQSAIELAQEGFLVTIGVVPTYPETGYGYITTGERLGSFQGSDAFYVDRFKEKPELELARQYVESGNVLWNTSMFVWRAQTLIEEMRRYLPSLAYSVERIAASWFSSRRHIVLADIWPEIEDVSIDHGILERSDRVAVIPAAFSWSDVGDWHGLGRVAGNGTDSTVILNAEQLVTLDVERSVVMGNGRMIALIGLQDLIVVDTPDALLVCHRSRAQEVKDLVKELKRRGATTLI